MEYNTVTRVFSSDGRSRGAVIVPTLNGGTVTLEVHNGKKQAQVFDDAAENWSTGEVVELPRALEQIVGRYRVTVSSNASYGWAWVK